MAKFKAKIPTEMDGRQVDIEITFPAYDESDAEEFLRRAYGDDVIINNLSRCDVDRTAIIEMYKPPTPRS